MALERPPQLLELSELAISLPDYVTFLQAHLCAAQGKPNPLLTLDEASRIYGTVKQDSATPLGWNALNEPYETVRLKTGSGGGFSGFAGFSKHSGRGAVMLVNVNGLWAFYAGAWVWEDGMQGNTGFARRRNHIYRPPPKPDSAPAPRH